MRTLLRLLVTASACSLIVASARAQPPAEPDEDPTPAGEPRPLEGGAAGEDGAAVEDGSAQDEGAAVEEGSAEDGGAGGGEAEGPEAAAAASDAGEGAAAAERGGAAAAPEAPAGSAAAQPGAPDPALVPPGGVPQVGPPRAPVHPDGARPSADEPKPEPEAEEAEPYVPPSYSIEVSPRITIVPGSGFSEALEAQRYGGSPVVAVFYVGAAFPIVEWLWVGGRLGIRGRGWDHPDRESALVLTSDLLVTLQARPALGPIFELGILAGVGAAAMDVRVNGVGSDQIVARVALELAPSFRVGNHFAIGPRVGWDYYQWENMNEYGQGVDIGGPYVGLALEGRE